MNPNTDYERFTQEVFRELSALEGINTVALSHNMQLKGKSHCKHQIDIYWEYILSGVNHKVAIECKNYSRPISIGKIRDFHSVLSDLENIAGIMVTKKGYQKGAKEYAAYYKINLKELRTPDESDGLIGEIEINTNTSIRRRLFLVDENWAKVNNFNSAIHREFLAIFLNSREWLESDYIFLDTRDSTIYNGQSQIITTFEELEDKLPPEGTLAEHIFKFEDAYVKEFERLVKIQEVKYLFISEHHTTVFGLEARDFVKAILKDALDGEIKFLGKYGNRNMASNK